MRNIKTIEKDIERTIARIKKNKDAIAKAKVRYNNAVAKCTKAGYEYTGDGKDHQHAYDTFKNWDLYNPIYTADHARESIADKERQIKGDEMQLEILHKEKEEAEARIKAVPQALKDYSVKLTQSYITEYTFRRDWAKGEIEELKADGRWNSREYWKERNIHSIWDGQDRMRRVANESDEHIAARAKEDAESLVQDLFYRTRNYVGVATDYSGLHVTTGTHGYAVINGFITGDAGKCEVRSIECGGYNIVCWHIRVIVVRAK